MGHRLRAEIEIALDATTTLADADAVTRQFEHELHGHLPALRAARIRVRPFAGGSSMEEPHGHHGHHPRR